MQAAAYEKDPSAARAKTSIALSCKSEVRHGQSEDELGAGPEGLVGANERSAARDVLRVVREERVEPFVLDCQLDRRTQGEPPLFGLSLGFHHLRQRYHSRSKKWEPLVRLTHFEIRVNMPWLGNQVIRGGLRG